MLDSNFPSSKSIFFKDPEVARTKPGQRRQSIPNDNKILNLDHLDEQFPKLTNVEIIIGYSNTWVLYKNILVRPFDTCFDSINFGTVDGILKKGCSGIIDFGAHRSNWSKDEEPDSSYISKSKINQLNLDVAYFFHNSEIEAILRSKTPLTEILKHHPKGLSRFTQPNQPKKMTNV